MKHKSQFSGIILGMLYGLVIRMISGKGYFGDVFEINNIYLTWAIPMIIGLSPILFANTKIYKSKIKQFFYPIITQFSFLLCAFVTRRYDFLYITIVGFVFFITAGIFGIAIGAYVKDRINNKKQNG
ncbi:DUF3021 family protein [Flavobacterium cerinum]|uniref:DUF3021 family protein n=1 Tax=Flavobacterium cerinum TaxID=2502784 RepID=A0ABY5ISP2_9FLAO|nr:DUF3021 family protein [Flavobacterium cerinum]UUC45867.1 DUF3021 family protein [Flavobacterium cerinum]